MTPNEYQQLALRTMADQKKIHQRLAQGSLSIIQLDNAARGMAGDVGEVNTCIQRCIEYGRPLDITNLIEELGDVLWRIVQCCDAIDTSLEMVMKTNIAKLSKRYPEKFSDEQTAEENRDREGERIAIEHTPSALPAIGPLFHLPIRETGTFPNLSHPVAVEAADRLLQNGNGFAEPVEYSEEEMATSPLYQAYHQG